jgi:multiple sugar transport system permease protein
MAQQTYKLFASQYRRRKFINKIIWIVVTVLIFFYAFFPIFWMFTSSVRSNQEVFTFPPTVFPKVFTLSAYGSVLQDEILLTSIFNSALVSLTVTLLSLSVASLGAYGMSRYNFWGKRLLMFYVLATQMIPLILLALPYYLVFLRTGLFDTRLGLIISYVAFTLPFCTLALTGFFNSIPRSLDESARIDGCTRLGAVIRIILPIAKPSLVATGIFAFITAWNEYLFAAVLTISRETRMLVVFIASKIGEYDINWAELMAVTVLASLPLILIYAFMQKSFMKGITAGAIKM